MTTHRWCLCALIPLLAAPVRTVAEHGPADRVRRVRGVIDKNQFWSGTIVITDDLTIDEATVTVDAGTVVEFAVSRPNHEPVLTIGGPDTTRGEMRILASADRPVVFRTRPGTHAGRLVVNVRSRIESPAPNRRHPTTVPGAIRRLANVTWKHVRFENLGVVQSRRLLGKEVAVARPCLTFHVLGGAHTLSLAHCVFDGSTRVGISAADGAHITLTENRFTNPRERLGLDVAGTPGQPPPGEIVIDGNTLPVAIRVSDAPVRLTGNRLIGDEAALIVTGAARPVRIDGNYIHNTTKDDDGRYCLTCENPEARIEDNILRGGTACVLDGSRHMSGNVLIAAPSLNSTVSRGAKTHQLVSTLPDGALFEQNLMLGPAFALLGPEPSTSPRSDSTQPNTSGVRIRHNLFDGFAASHRAIHLGRPGRIAGAVEISDNVFLRLDTIVFIENPAQRRAALRLVTNAAAPEPTHVIARVGAHGPDDRTGMPVVAQDVASLYLEGIPPSRVPDFDDDLRSGKMTVRQLRLRLFASYRPRAGSPLIGAGQTRSTLGPTEPARKRP